MTFLIYFQVDIEVMTVETDLIGQSIGSETQVKSEFSQIVKDLITCWTDDWSNSKIVLPAGQIHRVVHWN